MKKDNRKYCSSLTKFERYPSQTVTIGNIKIGKGYPICIQSMTTTNTMDIEATVSQSIRMIKSKCELVRITAPSIKEAEALKKIKYELNIQGYQTPLSADIHFTPKAAEIAATIVEKVRINPGNFVDKKKFETHNYSDESYKKELKKIKENFIPLINICKKNKTALRIGTNHGSLSDRIMSKYGDTFKGMVESAMEFLRICKEQDFDQVVLSMKSSNPKVMIHAYRLLVNTMEKEDMYFPLHLGVTEAGEGQDGRIKSALGIGTLLADGLGDTIRVSLTEEPEQEIPVAKMIVDKFKNIKANTIPRIIQNPINPFEYKKHETYTIKNIGGNNSPVVMNDFSMKQSISYQDLKNVGWEYNKTLDKWIFSEQSCDYLFLNHLIPTFEVPENLGLIFKYTTWLKIKKLNNGYPFFSIKEFLDPNTKKHPTLNFLYLTIKEINKNTLKQLKISKNIALVIDSYHTNAYIEQRRLFIELINNKITTPVIIGRAYKDMSINELQIHAAADIGGLFIDGMGDGIFIAAENCGSDEKINSTAFEILQATGTRISKTEYISCPSCGRTLFDLTSTTAKIREKTKHLKGLKIGIMGCIINGPGEMADADYGYVGTGPKKITLYKKKQIIQKNIPESKAVEALINLIKHYGDWVNS